MRKMPQYSEALDTFKFDSENYEITTDANVKLGSLRINYNSITPVDDYEASLSYWKRKEFTIVNPADMCYLQDMVDEDVQSITVFYKNALFGFITLPVNTNFSV